MNTATPATTGWVMPAEWAPHTRCWMAWPTPERWEPHFNELCKTHVLIAQTIARFEDVTMVVRPDQIAEATAQCGPNVNVLPIPVNDLWIRDTGPAFLVDQSGRLAGTRWQFNAWGSKHGSYADDAELSTRMLTYLCVEQFDAPLVNEGGAISVDGNGTVLTTESVLLNTNRNPGIGRAEVERLLCAYLGARNVIWLPGSTVDQITDGHIDGIAVFARVGVVIAELVADRQDPEYDILRDNLRALQLAYDCRGCALEVLTVHRPPHDATWSDDFAASYINFYIANGAIVMPKFGNRRFDTAARDTIARAFPGREVVQISIEDVAEGGGGIHCITQQQPATGGCLSSVKAHVKASHDVGKLGSCCGGGQTRTKGHSRYPA